MLAALLDAREFSVDQFQSAIEGLAEARFFLRNHFGSFCRRLFDLRIRVAHRLDHARMRHREERPMDSKIASMTRGATNDSPQHVFAIGVAGRDAVRDEKRYRPRMICNRTIRDVALDAFAVR